MIMMTTMMRTDTVRNLISAPMVYPRNVGRNTILVMALALGALSGVPCEALDEHSRQRLIRSGRFRIAQAQDRADGYRSDFLTRFGLDRIERLERFETGVSA